MTRPFVFESVPAMLEPAALSAILGEGVEQVTKRDWGVAHLSGNELFQVRVETPVGQTRLVLKLLHPKRDWVMRLTHDIYAREVALFEHGIYGRMPPEIEVPVLAVVRNAARPALLMRDVSSLMLVQGQELDDGTARMFVEHLAGLHLHFRNDAPLSTAGLGLCSMLDLVTIFSPDRLQAEIDGGNAHPVVVRAATGWREFMAGAPGDIQRIVKSAQDNPSQVVAGLERMPRTLIHGDYKLGNLGRRPQNGAGERTILIDWQDAAAGPPYLDLGYFLALNGRYLPFQKEEAIEIYTRALSEHSLEMSRQERAFAMCVGGPLRLLWLLQSSPAEELEWWYEVMREAF